MNKPGNIIILKTQLPVRDLKDYLYHYCIENYSNAISLSKLYDDGFNLPIIIRNVNNFYLYTDIFSEP